MTLSFRYKTIDRPSPYPKEDIPAIPITLIGPKERLNVIGLLDSGADFSFIPTRSIAEVLGLDLSKGSENIGGIGGDMEAIKSKLTINIRKGKESYTFPIYVYIATKDLKEDFPILIGRYGFFDKFKITFVESQKRVYLKKDNN